MSRRPLLRIGDRVHYPDAPGDVGVVVEHRAGGVLCVLWDTGDVDRVTRSGRLDGATHPHAGRLDARGYVVPTGRRWRLSSVQARAIAAVAASTGLS